MESGGGGGERKGKDKPLLFEYICCRRDPEKCIDYPPERDVGCRPLCR